MSTTMLDGKQLKQMLVCAAARLREKSTEINDLNVFPVPDGDTGTNMSMTLDGGIAEISGAESGSIGCVIEKFAHGMLLGARGNSGVILSQIFAGISEGLRGLESASVSDLSHAFACGVEKSYKAVMNPTEGTILTVFRESTEYAANNVFDGATVEDFLKLHIEEAERSLARTKEILPVLTEADVIDSGAAGYVCIAVGMYSALVNDTKIEYSSIVPTAASVDISKFTRDSKLEFGYCTEALLRLTNEKVNPDDFDETVITRELNDMGADSIVAFKNGDVVKIHAHSFTPGEVLTVCQKYGEFLTVKIENMSLSHTDKGEEKKKPKSPKKPFSVVAVASGDGISSLFCDLGADEIVAGGQSANPSIDEFVKAFERCSSEDIIVLPNNKNVFLAVRQAAQMWNGNVHIINTVSMMQGYSALSVITPGITDINALITGAERAIGGVVGIEITRAVRDATVNGTQVNQGEYMAISNGEITALGESAEDALLKSVAGVEDIDDLEILTLFVGASVSDDVRAEITEKLEDVYPGLEIVVYKGGQEVYDYLVAIE